MPRYIIKITDPIDNTDYFMEWSTIVDGPITYGCSLEEFKEYYKGEYGNHGMETFDLTINRVMKHGTSGHPHFNSFERLMDFNRLGENGEKTDLYGVLNKYCRDKIS
jgi:hypothetical protein